MQGAERALLRLRGITSGGGNIIEGKRDCILLPVNIMLWIEWVALVNVLD